MAKKKEVYHDLNQMAFVFPTEPEKFDASRYDKPLKPIREDQRRIGVHLPEGGFYLQTITMHKICTEGINAEVQPEGLIFFIPIQLSEQQYEGMRRWIVFEDYQNYAVAGSEDFCRQIVSSLEAVAVFELVEDTWTWKNPSEMRYTVESGFGECIEKFGAIN